MGTKGKKSYSHPKGYILDVVHDIVELQNGRLMISDAVHGRVLYRVAMYGFEWELLYTIIESEAKTCRVTIEVNGDRRDKVKEVRREFALLDSMLGGGMDVEISEEQAAGGGYDGLARAAGPPLGDLE